MSIALLGIFRSLFLLKLSAQVFPGILMVGTSPSFFKIPVTSELNHCVEYSDYQGSSNPGRVTGRVKNGSGPGSNFLTLI